jgi:hypothetical protein
MRCFMTLFAIALVFVALDSTQALAAKGSSSGRSGGQMQSNDHQNSGSSGSNAFNSGSNASGGTGFNLGTGMNKGMNSGKYMGQGMNSSGMNSNKVFDAKNKPEFSGGKGEGHDSWRYRWDNGRWWFWGPGNRWMWYGDDGRWLDYGNAYVVQRPILANFSGGPIKIVNPASNGVTLNYMLDGNAFTIPPGYSQDLREDRARVIQFSRGANLGQAQYGLQSGVYTFALTDHGWELYRSDFPTVATLPPPAAPTNPR